MHHPSTPDQSITNLDRTDRRIAIKLHHSRHRVHTKIWMLIPLGYNGNAFGYTTYRSKRNRKIIYIIIHILRISMILKLQEILCKYDNPPFLPRDTPPATSQQQRSTTLAIGCLIRGFHVFRFTSPNLRTPTSFSEFIALSNRSYVSKYYDSQT